MTQGPAPVVYIDGIKGHADDAPEYNDSSLDYNDTSTFYSGLIGSTGESPQVQVSMIDDRPSVILDTIEGSLYEIPEYNDSSVEYSDPDFQYSTNFQAEKPEISISVEQPFVLIDTIKGELADIPTYNDSSVEYSDEDFFYSGNFQAEKPQISIDY